MKSITPLNPNFELFEKDSPEGKIGLQCTSSDNNEDVSHVLNKSIEKESSSFEDDMFDDSLFEDDEIVHSSNKQSKLPQSEKLLELALWGSAQSVWTWDRTTNLVSMKFYLSESFQVIENQMDFNEFTLKVHPDDIDKLHFAWENIVSGNDSKLKIQLRYLDDIKHDYNWYEIRAKVSSMDDSGAGGVVGTFNNVSSRVKNQTSLKLMSEAFFKAKQPILLLNKSMAIIENKEAWTTEFDKDERISSLCSFAELVPISKADMLEIEDKDFFSKNTKLLLSSLNAERKDIDCEIVMNRFQSELSNAHYYIVLLKDLTESIRTATELHTLATIDTTTSLINRFELQNQMDTLIEDQHQEFDSFFIELNGVKNISDALGHQCSDSLLKDFATKLSHHIHDALHIARWGGNEFVIVYPKADGSQTKQRIKDINELVKQSTFVSNGQKFHIDVHIGVSRFPEHGTNASELIRKADAALYYSKENASENFQSIPREWRQRY